MTRFRSGRVTHQNIGISSFTENKTVLDVIGNALINGFLNVTGISTFNSVNVTGISTFDNAVDINSTLDVDGHTELDNLNVSGVSTFAGTLNADGLINASANVDIAGNLDVDGTTELDGLNVDGTTVLDDVVVGSALTVGQLTVNGLADFNGNLDVDGTTELDSLNVDGNTTLDDVIVGSALTVTGLADFNGNLDVDGTTELDGLNVDGNTTLDDVIVGSALTVTGHVDLNSNLDVDGITELDSLNVDGNTTLDDVIVGSALTVTGHVDLNSNLDVDGHTELDNLNVSGVSTFTSTVNLTDLDVDGHTELDNLNVSGVSTFASTVNLTDLDVDGIAELDDVNIDGTLTVNGLADLNGNLDVDGQTELDHLSVTGVSTFANTVIVNSLLYANSNVDISGNLDVDGTTELDGLNVDGHTNLDNVSISGVVTATTFVGDGDFVELDVDGHTNLDNVSIAGVVTATTFVGDGDFVELDVDGHTNLDNVSIAGVVTATTINATTFVGDGDFVELDVDGHTNLDNVSISGVVTATTFVGDGDFVELDVDGHTNLDNVSIAGVVTATTFIGDGNFVELDVDGHTNLDNVSISGVVTATTFIGNGDFVELDVDGHTNLDNVSIAGVVTATTFVGDGDFVELDVDGHANLDNVSIAGVTTFTGNIDADGDLDVDGHTNLDNVSIAGVTTFTGNIDADGDLDVDGHTELDNLNVSGVSTFSNSVNLNGGLDVSGHTELDSVNVSGVVTATEFHTGAEASAIRIDSSTISGPSVINLDPAGIGTNTGKVVIKGDFQVTGTETILDSTTVTINDKNIIVAQGSADDSQADGGGITIESGDGNKTFQFEATGDNLGSSEHLNLASGKRYKINNIGVLSANGLGSGVVNSSLTSVGTLNQLNVSGVSTFGNIVDINAGLDVDGHTDLDNVSISGVSTFGNIVDINAGLDVDGHTDLDNLSVAGVSTFASLVDIDGGGRANTFVVEDLTDNRIVLAGSGGELEDDGNLTFDGSQLNVGSGITAYVTSGIVSATAFYGDGSNLDNTGATLNAAAGTQRLVVTSLTSGTMVDAATDADLSFNSTDNTLNTYNLKVSGGISTDGADFGQDGQLLRADSGGKWSWAFVPGIFSVNNILNGFNVLEEGTTVGTAGSIQTLDFRGNNIIATADPAPNGIATVTVSDTPTFDTLTVTGQSDFSNAITVGSGVTIEPNGQATFIGIVTFGSSSTTINGNTDVINVGTALTIGHSQGLQFHTQNLHRDGFDVNQINASGIVTALEFHGDGSTLTGIAVTDHVRTDSLEVVGVTTFLDNVHVGSAITLYPATGIVSAFAFYGDGSNLTNTGASLVATSGVERLVTTKLTSGTMDDAATDSDLTYDATTDTLSAPNLNVGTGVTVYGNAGIVSATKFFGDGSNLDNTGATLNPASGTQRLVFTSLTTGTMVDAATDSDLTYDATTDTLSALNLNVGTGVTVYGNSGIVSATAFYGDGSNLDNTGASLNATSGVERLVTTQLTSGTMVNAATDADLTYDATTDTLSTLNLNVGTGVTVYGNAGIVSATSFYGDGSNLTNTGASLDATSGVERLVTTKLTSGTMVDAATDGDLTFDATTDTLSTLNLNVGTGVTVYGNAGIVSATAFYGDGSNLENTGATLNATAGVERLVTTQLTSGTMVDAATDGDLTFDATTDTLSAPNLNVGTGVTVYGNAGIVSAISFYGDGSNLTNTGASLNATSGVERLVTTQLTSGTMVDAATDSDLTYDASTDTLNVENIKIQGGISTNGSFYGNDSDFLVSTATGWKWTSVPGIFSVNNILNGFNVRDEGVIVGTAGSIHTLDFRGNNIVVSADSQPNGIATVTLTESPTFNNLTVNGSFYAGGVTGSSGQILQSTGTGIQWSSLPDVRSSNTFVATAGQTTFSVNYNTSFVDVYVNGVKLTGSEYNASSGSSITLYSACFAGDVVEVISYNTLAVGGGGGSANVIGINTAGTSGFTHINASGVVTATAYYGGAFYGGSYHGDGSNLTGIAVTDHVRSDSLVVSGISTFNGRIVGAATSNVIPFLYANYSDLPSPSTYHGAFAHVHATGRGYFAHAGNWLELVNRDTDGNVSVAGTITANNFSGDGSQLTNVTAVGLTGIPNVTVGDITANNISVINTLTYEDVTNVDSIGIVTARTGIHVNAGYGINVQSGVVTATTFDGNAVTASTATVAQGLTGRPAIDVRHIDSTGIKVTGILTATTLVGNLVGSVQGGNVNAYDGVFANNVSAGASITSSLGFYGDGSNITGIVTISDNAPTSPSKGDLWWKSDEGSLKIYYQDIDSAAWIDASPGGAGGSGGSGNSDIINDATPQLGGNLDVNGKNIVFGDSSSSNNNRLAFGAGSDLQIYHDGFNSYIRDGGSGNLRITGNSSAFMDIAATKTSGLFNPDTSVELSYNGSKKFETTNTGVIITGSLTAGGLTYPTSNGNSGDVLTSDGAGNVTWAVGQSTLSRGSISVVTSASHANNTDETLIPTIGKAYSLLKMVVSHQAWVRVYTSSAAATADSSRLITEDPLPGSGLIAEAITTTTNQTVKFTPALIGWNDESPVTANAYVVVRNRTGGTQAITVTLTKIELEA